VLDGGRRYLFHLRDDVRWTDGTPVTASDFEWAWKRNLAPATGSFAARMLDPVVGGRDFREGRNSDPESVGVHALDETTLEVCLEAPVAYFIYLVTQPLTYPLPRRVIESYGDEWWKPEHMVSNGAFRLTRYDEVGGALVRNPGYFGESPGNLDGIEWRFTSDSDDRIDEYLGGVCDAVWDISAGLIPPEIPPNEFYRQSELSAAFLVLLPTRSPLTDRRVRLALEHALNREMLLEVVRGPGSRPVDGGVIPVGMAGHSAELRIRHDPGLARRLLTEAGYSGGTGFPHLTLGHPASHAVTKAAEEIARQWRETLRIEMSLRPLPPVRGRPEDVAGIQVAIDAWAVDYPDPDSMLRQSNLYDSLRWAGWQNARYEELVDGAARTPDRARRMSMYRQADRLLVAEEVLIVPLEYGGRNVAALIRPWVKDLKCNALGYFRSKEIFFDQALRSSAGRGA